MKLHKSILTLLMISFMYLEAVSQVPGIYDLHNYLPFLKNKKTGLVVNQNSVINNSHLLDTLVTLGIDVISIFSPEHGFSGTLNAGEYFNDSIYNQSIPIISLYGKNKELKDDDLKNIDVMIFDIQDVGVRFYTYISTLHYVMEGCAKNNIKLIVLDKPNPHAHYVDGPVLDDDYSSFVGMHPVPIVYGMTIGEYALMINGEGWLTDNRICDIIIIKNSLYSRDASITYDFPVPPSPNLRNMNAILLYPSLCLFEGTVVSVGRGSDSPFEIFGSPFFSEDIFPFSFAPKPNFGSKNPKYNNELCYGWSLVYSSDDNHDGVVTENEIKNNSNRLDGGEAGVAEISSSPFQVSFLNLYYLIYAYNNTPDEYKTKFFNSFFNKLAGNEELKKQIISGLNPLQIRKSWENDLNDFQKIRKKYLLYN